MITTTPSAKGAFVEDFLDGDSITAQLGVRSREIKTDKAGRRRLALTFCDRTGVIDAVCWIDAEELAAIAKPGAVVTVDATVGQYNGSPQLTIQNIEPCTGFDPADFIRASDKDRDRMMSALSTYIDQVADLHIRCLLETIVGKHSDALRSAPAAMSIHHAFAGGLLEHILSMCGAAYRMARSYPQLNRDLLIAGCVLHDIGKIEEQRIGILIEYTDAGRLVGHIGLGLMMVDLVIATIPDFPDDLRLHVLHLIASHHGIPEHGALRRPATPEAIALHEIDKLDAKLEQAFRLIAEASAGDEWSGYVASLETALWRGKQEVSDAATT